LCLSRRPSHVDAPGMVVGAQADQHTPLTRRKVAPSPVDEADLFAAVAFNFDPSANRVAITLDSVAEQFKAEPGIVVGGAIEQQRDGAAVVAESKVRPAVVVKIGPGQPPAHAPLLEIAAR